MPEAPPSICSYPGCGELVYSGSHCSPHKKQKTRRNNENRSCTDRLYGSGRWKKLRAFKLKHDPLCESCKRAGRVTQAKLVDHIQPVRDGGSMWDLDNLQSLCRECHDIKTVDDIRNRSS